MSFINLNWYISLAFCLFFFIGGRQLAEATAEIKRTNPRAELTLRLILFILAIPSLFFPVAYLPGTIAVSPWYNTFRSINRIELFSSLIAPAAGYATYCKPIQPFGVPHASDQPPLRRALKPLAFPFCIFFISVNFVSPLLKPISKDIIFTDAWVDDGIYLMTVYPTSGPSSLLSAMYNINYNADNELDAARGMYTDRSGTEFWYISRYAVNRGYRTKFIRPAGIGNAPCPAIVPVSDSQAGVRGYRPSAYVALLKRSGDGKLTVGDPAAGRLELSENEFISLYGDPALVLALSAPRAR